MPRVLVIDDDDDFRAIVKDVLEASGYEVDLAADGAQGLTRQRSHPAGIIIMDIFMPQKEGIETIREIRQEFPDAAIIAVSGGGRLQRDGHLFTAKELGARVILRKPFAMDTLLKSIENILKGT